MFQFAIVIIALLVFFRAPKLFLGLIGIGGLIVGSFFIYAVFVDPTAGENLAPTTGPTPTPTAAECKWMPSNDPDVIAGQKALLKYAGCPGY